MSEPYCYLVGSEWGDGETVKPNLRQAMQVLIDRGYLACGFVNRSFIAAHFKNGDSKRIKMNYFIEPVNLNPEDIREIEEKIDTTITNNEIYLSNLTHGVTGYFLLKDSRSNAIKEEITRKSYRWKDLDLINFDDLGREIYE